MPPFTPIRATATLVAFGEARETVGAQQRAGTGERYLATAVEHCALSRPSTANGTTRDDWGVDTVDESLNRCGYLIQSHVQASAANIIALVFITLLITPPIIADVDQAADEAALFVHRLMLFEKRLQKNPSGAKRAKPPNLHVVKLLVWINLQARSKNVKI